MRPVNTCAVLGLILVGAAGCSSTSPHPTGRLVFQIATTPAGTASGGPAAAAVTVTLGTDVLVISEVQLVARKIRLVRADGCVHEDAEVDQGDANEANEANEPDAENENNDMDEGCPTLRLGPVLLVPPLTDGAQTTFVVDVPVGTYTKLQLQIHRPKAPKDQAFLTAHPGFEDVSIQVTGTYNGAPFTFVTGLSAEEEVSLSPPVVVSADGPTSFTLLLDVRGWFLNQAGTGLLNPISISAENRAQVEQNIRSGFEAFEDEDHDGHEDGEHEGH